MTEELKKLTRGLEVLFEIDPTMQVSTALVLLYPAVYYMENNEYMHQRALDNKMQISTAVVSRNVKYWSKYKDVENRVMDSKTTVLDFLENDPDPTDRRFRRLTITRKGDVFLRRIAERMKNG